MPGTAAAIVVRAPGAVMRGVATVTLSRLPEDQREAIVNEVHTLLAPFVMRHEVAFG